MKKLTNKDEKINLKSTKRDKVVKKMEKKRKLEEISVVVVAVAKKENDDDIQNVQEQEE